VRHISNDGQHAVVLAIDELMKAEAITGNVMPLLTYIGRVLDSSPQVPRSGQHARPGGRGQHHRLFGASRALGASFTDFLQALDRGCGKAQTQVSGERKGTPERPEFAERSLESEECCAVRAVIADCNGHPRSLEKSLRDPSDLQRGTTPPPAPSPPPTNTRVSSCCCCFLFLCSFLSPIFRQETGGGGGGGEVDLFCDSFWQAACLSTHTVPVQAGANKSP